MKSIGTNSKGMNLTLAELRQKLIADSPLPPPHCLIHWIQPRGLELTRNYVVSILKGEEPLTQTHHKKQCLRAMRPDDFNDVFLHLEREGRFNTKAGQDALNTARKEISFGLVARKLQYRSQRMLIKFGANLQTFALTVSLFGNIPIMRAGGHKAYRDKLYETKAKAKGIFTSLLKEMNIDKDTFQSESFTALRTTLETARLRARGYTEDIITRVKAEKAAAYAKGEITQAEVNNISEDDQFKALNSIIAEVKPIHEAQKTGLNPHKQASAFKHLNLFVDPDEKSTRTKHLFLSNVQKREIKTLQALSGKTDTAVLEPILINAFKWADANPTKDPFKEFNLEDNIPGLPAEAAAKNELLKNIRELTVAYQKQVRLEKISENAEENSGLTQFRPF
jgi:hypothetical protein